MFFHKKPPHKSGCLACHIIVTVLLFLGALASLVGVVMAHIDPVDRVLVFGTSAASLSLIAFAVTSTFCMKQLKTCMSSCDVCYPPSSAPLAKMMSGKKK
jgi:hypothetical protein